jgi:hypothetical protein
LAILSMQLFTACNVSGHATRHGHFNEAAAFHHMQQHHSEKYEVVLEALHRMQLISKGVNLLRLNPSMRPQLMQLVVLRIAVVPSGLQ